MSEEILKAVNECPFCASLLNEKIIHSRFPEGVMVLVLECSNPACEYSLASKEPVDMRYGYGDIEKKKHAAFAQLESLNALLHQKMAHND